MPRLRAWIMAGIFLAATITRPSAELHFFQNVIDARGGCGNIHTLNMIVVRSTLDQKLNFGETDVDLFGKPILKWSDDDIAASVRIYKECWAKRDVAQRPGRGPSPFGQGAAVGFENNLRELVAKARNIDNQKKAKEAAQIELKKARAQSEREQAEEEAQRKQAQLREQARLDREAAEEALRLAEREAPKIAEAEKEAAEARRARQAAEEKLAEIRNRVGAEVSARNEALARSQTAEAARQRELERQAELKEKAAPRSNSPSDDVEFKTPEAMKMKVQIASVLAYPEVCKRPLPGRAVTGLALYSRLQKFDLEGHMNEIEGLVSLAIRAARTTSDAAQFCTTTERFIQSLVRIAD